MNSVESYKELKQKNIKLENELSIFKDTEHSLIKERDFIRNVLYWIDSLVVVIDLKGYIVNFNKSSEKLSGYRFEEVQDKPFWDILISIEERESVKSAITDVIEKGLPDKFQNSWVTKDGSKRFISWVNSILTKQDGSIDYILCTGWDITEQKQTERKLLSSEEKYRELVQHANSIILRVDTQGHILFFNEYAQDFFGFTENEILNQNIIGTIIPQTESSGRDLKAMFDDIIQNPHQYLNNENENIKQDGGRVWVAWTNKAIFDRRGNIEAVLCVGNDITDRKRAEEKKIKLEAQLRQSQKMESIGTLAGGVAHDFNNMLSIILGYGENLLDQLHSGDPLREDAKEILAAGQRSASLTRQLLAFSRRQTLQPVVLNLNEIVTNLEKMLGRLIGEDVELNLSLPKELDLVMVDLGQIEQVIMNLAVNARDAMPGGGKLIIETANVELDEAYADNHPSVFAGKYVMLAITDTGDGMDMETLSKGFEPFFTTKEKGRGTGLGLSTVYGIVKQSEGNIWAYSEIGVGTTFKVYLPKTETEASTETLRPEKKLISGRGEYILVVEDEKSVRNLITKVLSKQGYQVHTAANGGEALLLVEEECLKPDIVISDVVMPGISGTKLIERMRHNEPGLKVLYMSGYTDEAIVHHGILDADTPFIQKPFNIRDLIAKVQDLLL